MNASGKRALALSGGGFTGYLFEIGALTALDDLFDDGFSVNDFDLHIGVSAGSAAAALLANGVKPEEIFETNLSGRRPYYFEHRDIFSPAIGEGFKTILRAGRQLVPLLKLYVQHYSEMTLIDLLDKAQDALPSGIYTLEPFARYLETTFAAKGLSNTFAGLRRELYIPAIDLDTSESVIFGDDGWLEVPISRAVTASSAAPIYFCPVRIDGHDYIDAGIGRLAFFEIAVTKGVDSMVMINPMVYAPHSPVASLAALHAARDGHLRDKGFLSIGEQASRINFDARFSQALRLFQQDHPNKHLFVITPPPSETLLFQRSFLSYRDRIRLLRAGYLSVATLVTEQFDYMHAQFGRYGLAVSRTRFTERMRRRFEQLAQVEERSITQPRPATAEPLTSRLLPTLWSKAD